MNFLNIYRFWKFHDSKIAVETSVEVVFILWAWSLCRSQLNFFTNIWEIWSTIVYPNFYCVQIYCETFRHKEQVTIFVFGRGDAANLRWFIQKIQRTFLSPEYSFYMSGIGSISKSFWKGLHALQQKQCSILCILNGEYFPKFN